MFEVLLPVDEDPDRASAQAEAVASLPWEGEIHVVVFHVFHGENPEGSSVGQLAAARRARERLEAAGISVSMDESSGDPAEEVLDRARELDVDLLTAAGRRRSPAGKLLLGSVSQELLRRSDRPVLFCSTGDEEG